MSHSVQDLQMLRLIKAFQKIAESDARRMVLLYVERQQVKTAEQAPPSTSQRMLSSCLLGR
jgi:hypothetical protein